MLIQTSVKLSLHAIFIYVYLFCTPCCIIVYTYLNVPSTPSYSLSKLMIDLFSTLTLVQQHHSSGAHFLLLCTSIKLYVPIIRTKQQTKKIEQQILTLFWHVMFLINSLLCCTLSIRPWITKLIQISEVSQLEAPLS